MGAGALSLGSIAEYGLIGDCRSAALVSRDGSIDWLCWPRFDSPSCFAALLGTPCNGRWRIAPAAEAQVRRAYRDATMVLETVFTTDEGEVALIDFMPVDGGPAGVVRILEGRRGRVAMAMEVVLRFDYGAAVPWVTRLPDGHGIRAVAGPDQVVLRGPVPLRGHGLTSVAAFDVAAGETLAFTLAHGPGHEALPRARDAAVALEETVRFWSRWAGGSRIDGPHADLVRRSLLVLKALTHAETGGMVAAPTTSLPEQPGGTRNWDYRYCWLRDAALALRAFVPAGYFEEVRAWRDWLHRALAGSPAQMRIMYGLAGERRLPEWEVPWLPGHGGAAPVRVGNGAAGQLQHDVFGMVTMALLEAREAGLPASADSWNLQVKLMEHLEQVWHLPDEGIWEVRGGRRHFTFSKVMAWVALDRSIRAAEQYGLAGPLDRWRALRARIHAAVCEQGVDARRGCFVQSFGDTALDASLLQIPLVGFLPIHDPRVAATIAAIEAELMPGGLVLRYDTRHGADGLPPGEGAFLACSFWLVEAMALQGRRPAAEALFARLAGLCNDLGLFAEMHDPAGGTMLGNFPQAFTHAALVSAALRLVASRPA